MKICFAIRDKICTLLNWKGMFRSAKASSRLSPRLARPSLAMFTKDNLPVRVLMNENRNISLSVEQEFKNSEH